MESIPKPAPETNPLDGTHFGGEGTVTALFVFLFSLFFLRVVCGIIVCKQTCVGAASTAEVLPNLQEHRLKIPVPFRPVTKGTAAEVKARMCTRRWRARWAARHGKLRILDEVPFAEMQHKAPVFYDMLDMVFGFWGPRSGTVLGARFRPQTWVRFCILDQKAGPFLVPDSGTQSGTAVHTFNTKTY